MTEQELNVFLDLEWNCAAFTPEEASVSAPLSPKQWACIVSRHPELQEFCPFSEFTPADWVVVLEKQLPFAWRCSCWKDFTPHQWQRLLRHQPTLLHYCEIPDHPAVRSGLLASGWSYASDIDTHDFTLGDWFWVVKHNPQLWTHCPCQEQFTKPMWWSILYSSAELLPDCPCLDQFSDEDWRRLNILPKLKSRIRNSEQFRKLIDLTRHPFRHLKFDDDLPQ